MTELAETHHHRRWPIIVVIVATLVVFLPLCGHEFTYWDDGLTVHQNPMLNPPTLETIKYYFSHVAYGLYIPITYTVWAGIAMIAGVDADDHNIRLNPWMFHSANVAFHTVSAIVVFLLLRRLVRKDWAACFGALLWALHPMQLEPVAWVSGLKDVLAGCFGLIALWRYIARAQDRSDDPQSIWAPDIIGMIALILAMLSKPSAAMVPAIAVAIDWLILNRPLPRALQSTAVWFVLAIPILVVGRIAQDVTGIPTVPIHLRPFIAADSIAFYLYKLIWPVHLAPDYGRNPRVVFQHGWQYYTWIAALLLAIAMFILRKRFRWAVGAAAIFVIALLPVLGLATFQFQFMSTVADHYMYLAMLGPAVAVAFVLSRVHAPAVHVIAVIAIVLLGVRTGALAPVWKDDYTLFEHNLKVNPLSVISLNNLGNAYTLNGDYEKGLTYFKQAMSISDEYPTPFENAGRVLAQLNDIEGSIAASERSIVIRSKLPLTLYPNYMEDHNYVGQVLLARGQYDRAIAHFEKLLWIKPEHADAKKFLVIAFERKGQKAATQESR
ncbi:MAG: tetratricopeptide repeat protein [Anaerolineae bacterium]|nr:tetratricopeptide repeat protein [Phycisphaerae bacterium]